MATSELMSDLADDCLELYSSLVINDDLREIEGEVPVTLMLGNCNASTVRLDVEAMLSLGARITGVLSVM